MAGDSRPRTGWFTWLGVFLALFGPVVVAGPPALLAGDPDSPAAIFIVLCAMWVLAIILSALVTGPERASLSSIGLQAFRWRSVGFGLGGALAIALAMLLVLAPFGDDVHAGVERGVGVLAAWPLWLKVFAVVTAGVTEEVLYRGYAITRLELLTGNRLVAAGLSLAVFTVVHLPFWGAGAAAAVLAGGGALTLLFLWKRDLLLVVVAHTAIDAFSLFVQPALGLG